MSDTIAAQQASMAAQQASVQQQAASAAETIAGAAALAVGAAAGWAAAERAAEERVAATGAAVEAAAAEHAAAEAALAKMAALAGVAAAACAALQLADDAGPSTGTRPRQLTSGMVPGGRAAEGRVATPAAAAGALLQAEAMRWFALMQAELVDGGRLAVVLAEMQQVQLQQAEAMQWLARMHADPLAGDRLSEVLAEMQVQRVRQDECIVCMDRPRSVTLLPCGHRVLCAACCSGVRGGNGKVRVRQRHGACTVTARALESCVCCPHTHARSL
jgi:hypothetical protein